MRLVHDLCVEAGDKKYRLSDIQHIYWFKYISISVNVTNSANVTSSKVLNLAQLISHPHP